MVFPVLQSFDTSDLDASKNGQELCNELKRLYDHLMTAVAAQSFAWDSTTYTRNGGGNIISVKHYINDILVQKDYTYVVGFIETKKVWIKGVPPVAADWHYVFGFSYARDADDLIISATNIGQ